MRRERDYDLVGEILIGLALPGRRACARRRGSRSGCSRVVEDEAGILPGDTYNAVYFAA